MLAGDFWLLNSYSYNNDIIIHIIVNFFNKCIFGSLQEIIRLVVFNLFNRVINNFNCIGVETKENYEKKG